MSVTFDGPSKQIQLSASFTDVDVQTDVYSAWKQWVKLSDNAKYLQALRSAGGDPLNPQATQLSGRYFFLLNGWKLVAPPNSASIDQVNIDGNIFSEDGSDIFTTAGSEILIRQTVSSLSTIELIPVTASVVVSASIDPASSIATASYVGFVAGGTVDTASYVATVGSIQNVDTASLVLDVQNPVDIAAGQTIATASYVANVGNIQNVSTASLVLDVQNPVDIAAGQTVATASYVATVGNIQTVETSSYVQTVQSVTNPVTIAAGQFVTASLADNQIVSASLSGAQETMLLEIYRIFGLDPTRPLVVTPSARTASPEISQSISKTGDAVTVTRS